LEDNIDNLLAYVGAGGNITFDNEPTTTTGLTFGYLGGNYRENNTVTSIADSSILLTASSTNYVEINKSGVIVKNTTGFTSGYLPLWQVTTDGAAITGSVDKRSWVVSTDADNLSFTSTTLTSVNVRTAIEEAAAEGLAAAIVFGG
jgi:hypothetical protein